MRVAHAMNVIYRFDDSISLRTKQAVGGKKSTNPKIEYTSKRYFAGTQRWLLTI